MARSDAFGYQMEEIRSWNLKKLPGNEPWITKEGFLDSTKFPIDNVLKHALSDDDRVFRSGLRILRLMSHEGRIEAGVFLMGASPEL